MTTRQHSRRGRKPLITLASVIALAAHSVEAQDRGESASANVGAGGELAEVIVTAQFREQPLQDTPIAITALTGEALAARGQTSLTDLQAPNLSIEPAPGVFGPAAQIYMRGVGQFDSNFTFEPGVGVYIDDVYYSTLFGNVFELLDLDRVEVLRGPQGTLAGKNSIGGAIKLYSKKPDGSGTGFLEAQAGSYNLAGIRGAADFSLVPDKVFVRLSGLGTHQDGSDLCAERRQLRARPRRRQRRCRAAWPVARASARQSRNQYCRGLQLEPWRSGSQHPAPGASVRHVDIEWRSL
jgi:iron complex outermembrane recepter protein